MSGAVNPLAFPQTWDTIMIGQVRSPGVCQVTGFKREFDWDIKKGKGTLGATVTFTGRPPVAGSIKFLLWTEDHFTKWDVFRNLLKYDPTKKSASPVDIYHPALADIGVASVVTTGIGAIEHDGQQLYSITIDFLEYFPPPKKSAVSTPSGSKGTQKGTTPGAPVDPIEDAKQKEIARLLKQAALP